MDGTLLLFLEDNVGDVAIFFMYNLCEYSVVSKHGKSLHMSVLNLIYFALMEANNRM